MSPPPQWGGVSFSLFFSENLGSHFYTQMTKTWVTFFFGPPHCGGGHCSQNFGVPPHSGGGQFDTWGVPKLAKWPPHHGGGGTVPPHGGGFHFRYFFEGFGPLHHGGGTSEIPKSAGQKSSGPAALHHVKYVKIRQACGASHVKINSNLFEKFDVKINSN